MMAGLFGAPSFPSPPQIDHKKIEREKRRQLALHGGAGQMGGTILSGGGGITSPIIGAAAQLQGGLI